mmetsp:Transcript_10750/g.35676  ORF Transcript_10750/g.35676 Transcript_10750/m.35676 type:complete len:134 (+) Transcript_10750:67-468(+)
MSTGDNLLSVLNTLESRAIVLEAELGQIDADIALNATMARKYGESTLADGSARLAHMRMEKSIRLAEIQTQLHDTSQSVRKGKQLLSTLSDDIAHPSHPSPLLMPSRYAGTPSDSPQRILTTSSILSGRRQPR